MFARRTFIATFCAVLILIGQALSASAAPCPMIAEVAMKASVDMACAHQADPADMSDRSCAEQDCACPLGQLSPAVITLSFSAPAPRAAPQHVMSSPTLIIASLAKNLYRPPIV